MEVKLKPIVPKKISFWISGTSPMIQHAWAEKGLKQMRMTASERKKVPKVGRDPEIEANDAMYKLKDGSPACPMLAIKASLIGAAHKDLGIEKTLVRKALFLPSPEYEPGLLSPLYFDSLEIREDIVRIGQGQTDLRYRPEFTGWRVNVILEVDTDLINEQDIVNLVNRAGFSVGVGEWRPEKGGEYGRFEFDTTQGIKEIGYAKARKAKKS
jgi:hypothetical protein